MHVCMYVLVSDAGVTDLTATARTTTSTAAETTTVSEAEHSPLQTPDMTGLYSENGTNNNSTDKSSDDVNKSTAAIDVSLDDTKQQQQQQQLKQLMLNDKDRQCLDCPEFYAIAIRY